MAYENGTNLVAYFPNCIKKYEKDNKIFEKTILLLNLYMQMPTWPHCIHEFKAKANEILGEDPEFIGEYGIKLKDFYNEGENVNISQNFKIDLYTFSNSTYDILDNSYIQRINPIGLYSISSLARENDFILKLFRNDKKSLELELSKSEIQSIIEHLESMIEEE